jgi:hypothetical protein
MESCKMKSFENWTIWSWNIQINKDETCENKIKWVKKNTQNLFEVNLTIVVDKIWHDYEWGCNTLVQICMGLL